VRTFQGVAHKEETTSQQSRLKQSRNPPVLTARANLKGAGQLLNRRGLQLTKLEKSGVTNKPNTSSLCGPQCYA